MKISEKGINLIHEFEGLRLQAYKVLSSEKYYTIGWGHYGSDVYPGMIITRDYADKLFLQDIKRYEDSVNNCKLGFKPNQNQYDALVSFCYNLGVNIMNDFIGMSAKEVASEMLLYVNSGGQRLQGLVNRRKKEVELFNTLMVTQQSNSYPEVGVATVLVNNLRVRNSPSLKGEIIDNYYVGELINYDSVYKSEGYYWISYVSNSGIRRYVASRTVGSNEIYLSCK